MIEAESILALRCVGWKPDFSEQLVARRSVPYRPTSFTRRTIDVGCTCAAAAAADDVTWHGMCARSTAQRLLARWTNTLAADRHVCISSSPRDSWVQLPACYHSHRQVIFYAVLARDAQVKLALIVAQIYPSVHPSVCVSVRSIALRVASHIDYRLVCLSVCLSLCLCLVFYTRRDQTRPRYYHMFVCWQLRWLKCFTVRVFRIVQYVVYFIDVL